MVSPAGKCDGTDFRPDFSKGLVPAIAQDTASGEVLMLAYMNEEAWRRTLETGEAHYWSRSRQQLWRKGERSGHVQKVRSVRLDCDSDAILLRVEQLGDAACHTGRRSCFFREWRDGEVQICSPAVFDPQKVYGTVTEESPPKPTPPLPTLPLLKLGVPKGSLEEATIHLFARAGWKIHKHTRNYFPDINDPDITASLCRVQEIGSYVAAGILDVGITGLDWLLERGHEDAVVRIADLAYSKTSSRPCRWVLAVAGDSPYRTPKDLAGKRIATELEGLTRRYFDNMGVSVDIFYSWGATEAKVVEGLADGIVEVTETGTTIRAHGLRIIDEVMVSTPVLIANPAAWEDPVRRAKIKQLRLLLQGALRAENLVALKMNAPATHLDAILEMLPSLNSPTVSSLRDTRWLSVETVVAVGVVRDLIPRLREAGAEGIIEYALNKVI